MAFPLVEINSYDELVSHEEEILKRIAAIPNGGALYLIDPLRLFDELNVRLANSARCELLQKAPHIQNYGKQAYELLKNTKARQRLNVRIRPSMKGDEK